LNKLAEVYKLTMHCYIDFAIYERQPVVATFYEERAFERLTFLSELKSEIDFFFAMDEKNKSLPDLFTSWKYTYGFEELNCHLLKDDDLLRAEKNLVRLLKVLINQSLPYDLEMKLSAHMDRVSASLLSVICIRQRLK
jgi:hypothetical protein